MVRQRRSTLNRKFTSKGGIRMNTLLKEKEPSKLFAMANMRQLIQNSMKQKGLTSNEARKSLGIKRYEKQT